MKAKIVFLLLLVITFPGFSQKFMQQDGQHIVDLDGKKIILRGMGLGGWMLQEGYMLRVEGIGQQQHVVRGKLEELVGKEKTNTFYEAWLRNHTTRKDIDSMASWGFNSVRLAMHYNLYTLPVEQEPVPRKNTWLEKGFVMTDSLLKWCAANKMYLILDLHAAPGGQGNDLNIADRDPSKPYLWTNEENRKKTIALWRKLAERYANEPWIGAYDIINEPNYGFEKSDDRNGCGETLNAPLKKLMVDITAAIREVDKNHMIIVEGNCWGNNYNGIFPLWDNNMAVSFHKYWNYNDQASIQKFVDIRKQYNVPVWLGESGENSNLWFRDAINLVERNEIGWAWWPLKKLRHNNPLEVKVPEGWQKILDYWKGGEKPSADVAFGGMMELAENLKIENCMYHRDVIDAMFRQIRSDDVVPFKKLEFKSGMTWSAVDYDLGRNGFAYFDKDSANYWVANSELNKDGNQGRVYRNDGVDITRKENEYFVTRFEPGEWIQYSIDSKGVKTLTAIFSFSSQVDSEVEIDLNGKKRIVSIPKTSGVWKDFTVEKLSAVNGRNTLRVKVTRGEPDFLKVRFK